MALLFLMGAAMLGVGLVRLVLRRWLSHAEQALWGLVAGWMLSTLCAYLWARGAGRLSSAPLHVLNGGMWAGSALLWLPTLRRVWRGEVRARSLWRAEYAGLLVVLALFAPVCLRLFWTRMLMPGEGGVYSGGSTWYDLGFHLALTSSFLYGQNFPPVHPAFPPAPLHYPFLPDFLTAVLVSLGMSLRVALVSTGVALSLAVAGLLYAFARRIGYFHAESGDGATARGIHSQVAGALAVTLFLLNGGFGFLYFFADWSASGRGLLELVWHPPANYANLPERQIHWTNIVADTLLPQRTSLFGLPAALMIFTLFAAAWARWSEGEGSDAERGWSCSRPLLAAGCLAGALPLFHMHSYAAVGLVSGFLFCLRPRKAWLAFWLPAVLLALPSLVSVLGHAAASGFVRLQPGWRGHAAGWWWPLYWVSNVGVVALLALPAWWATPRPWRRFHAAFVLLLVFILLVVVSPNDYDNIKLMYYWYAATCVLVAGWLVRLADARRWRLLSVVCVALLALASTASGMLALRHEASSHQLFISKDALIAAEFVRAHTAPRALFLSAPDFQQPASALAGRLLLRGEFLWHHGYPHQEREADVRRIYTGADDALELLRYYRIEYVYLGERERRDLKADERFFARHFPAVFQNPAATIYDVRTRVAHSDGDAKTDADAASRAPDTYPPREFAARVRKDPYQLLVEFPRAGFALYRFYLVAYGRWPSCEEFISGMEALGRGVYVGATGWEERLEENKRAFIDALVEGAQFKTAHEGKSAGQVVDALYANAKLEPKADERLSLVAGIERGAESYASGLRRVAEDRALRRREYNAAFVLAHYYGYLRRAPDDPPDKNLDGFNFWLRLLESNGDERSLSRAFMESGEYKDRQK
ncbi:MAG TPA: hypothetical protein VGB73_03700 [Pyrinomonadaceae bacterium]